MTQQNNALARRVLAWVFSAATLLLAGLLIAQCADIYRVGTSAENLTETGVRIQDIYTRPVVIQRLGQIAWAFWLWLAALVAAIVGRVVCKAPAAKRPPLPLEYRRQMTITRAETTPAMAKEVRLRRMLNGALAAVLAVCTGFSAVYLCNLENFASRDLELTMGQMLLHVGPWVLVAMAALMVRSELVQRSMTRELEAAKAAPRRTPAPVTERASRAGLCRWVILAVAAVLIALGVSNGGMRDVLVKAINICTECIGLG